MDVIKTILKLLLLTVIGVALFLCVLFAVNFIHRAVFIVLLILYLLGIDIYTSLGILDDSENFRE